MPFRPDPLHSLSDDAHSLFLAGSVAVPHLQSHPGRGIRRLPLMKLSVELTARHRAVYVYYILLLLCPLRLCSPFSVPRPGLLPQLLTD